MILSWLETPEMSETSFLCLLLPEKSKPLKSQKLYTEKESKADYNIGFVISWFKDTMGEKKTQKMNLSIQNLSFHPEAYILPYP